MAKRGTAWPQRSRERASDVALSSGVAPRPNQVSEPASGQRALARPDDDLDLQSYLTAPAGEPGHDEHEARLFAQFFSWPPPPVEWDPAELWFEPARMSRESRRAMWTALIMLGVSLSTIGTYTGYYHFVIPQPVELGDGAQADGLHLPMPDDASHAQRVAARSGEAATVRWRATLRPAEPQAAAPDTELPVDPDVAAAQAQGVEDSASPASAAGEASLAATSSSAAWHDPAPPLDRTQAHSGAAPSFEAWLARARELADRKAPEQALQAFDRALTVRAYAPQALAGKASALLHLNHYEAAKVAAEEAVAIDPKSSEGLMVLGAALEQLGSVDAAQMVYERCLEQAVGGYREQCRQRIRRPAPSQRDDTVVPAVPSGDGLK